MRKVVLNDWMSLDGVYQSPSGPDEDADGGFAHGGWASPYFDDIAMRWLIENVSRAGGFLLGRRTYQIFASHWPSAPDDQQVLAEPMNRLPKYVASTTLREPLEWQNSRLLHGDVAQTVRRLKHEDGRDLRVIGGGKRLFRDDGRLTKLRLVDSKATSTGAIIATYAVARN
jgi:dihydrofolate reductase